MNRHLRHEIEVLNAKYGKLKDPELVDCILSGQDSNNVLFYLVYGRYYPILEVIAYHLNSGNPYVEDLISELELHLAKEHYKVLRSFRGDSSFKTWLNTVAMHLFINKMPALTGWKGEVLPLDDFDKLQDAVENDELMQMMEAIERLENDDGRFILLKEIEGYSPDEIAHLLAEKREREGKEKEYKGDKVKLNAAYIYMLKSRTLIEVGKLMKCVSEPCVQQEPSLAVHEEGTQGKSRPIFGWLRRKSDTRKEEHVKKKRAYKSLKDISPDLFDEPCIDDFVPESYDFSRMSDMLFVI